MDCIEMGVRTGIISVDSVCIQGLVAKVQSCKHRCNRTLAWGLVSRRVICSAAGRCGGHLEKRLNPEP